MELSRRILFVLLALAVAVSAPACGGEEKPATPKETLHTYSKARKKKDLTAMKLLLSKETLKMHEQEAKSMGSTVDDVIERESLVAESQTVLKVRNEKIEGERATLEVQNAYGVWETLPFVFEDDQWKIDKKGYADRLMQDIERDTQRLDQMIESGGLPGQSPTPLQ